MWNDIKWPKKSIAATFSMRLANTHKYLMLLTIRNLTNEWVNLHSFAILSLLQIETFIKGSRPIEMKFISYLNLEQLQVCVYACCAIWLEWILNCFLLSRYSFKVQQSHAECSIVQSIINRFWFQFVQCTFGNRRQHFRGIFKHGH